MAAPVIQSYTTSGPAATDPVPTKPTGLAEGDLMLAFVFSGSTVGNGVESPTTPSGWTIRIGAFWDGPSDTHRLHVFYKIADSSDVAASDFTFDCDNIDAENTAVLCRITGHAASAPIDTAAYEDNGSGANPTVTLTNGTIRTSDTLMFMAWFTTGITAGAQAFSNYVANGITNPSWTELIDFDGGAGDSCGALAHAVSGQAGTVTTIEVDEADGDQTNFIGLLVTLPPTTNATINADLATLTGAKPTPSLTGNANVTADLATATLATPAPDTTQVTPKWNNTTKPAVSSFENISKS